MPMADMILVLREGGQRKHTAANTHQEEKPGQLVRANKQYRRGDQLRITAADYAAPEEQKGSGKDNGPGRKGSAPH